MKKTPGEKVENTTAHLPKALPYFVMQTIFKCKISKSKAEFAYHFPKSEMKGKQVILIADHACTESYLYVAAGYPFVRLNAVMGKHHFYKKLLLPVFLWCGCIPKSLFESDTKSTKLMLSVIKKGGSLLLFPEGVQSSNGGTQPINPTTAKFLKKCALPVVLCKSFGAYLSFPKYDEVHRYGRQEYHYELLFSEEEIKHKKVDEINRKLIEKFRYNDFEWNSENKYRYSEPNGIKNARGLDNLIYRCPKCGKEFDMHIEDDDIVCGCGNRIKVYDTYELEAMENSVMPYKNITEWHYAQRECVREEVRDDKFSVSYECDLIELRTDRLVKEQQPVTGHGMITINHKQLIYKGSRYSDDNNVELVFEIPGMPSFVSMPNRGNEFYYKGEFFMFRPMRDVRESSKYQLIVEELHNLNDEKWRTALDESMGR